MGDEARMNAPTVGSLFAGIGGFELAFSRAGFTPSWSVEIDKDCRAVLHRHFPDSALFDDVQTVGAHNLTPVDVITFGSPCQDLSVAGRRAGLDGKRSGLFFEAIRIVAELKPAFAVFENVPGALSSNDGRDFGIILMAFRELGARDIAWRVLDAQHFGVPQRRRRIFLVADFGGEHAAEVLFESESMSGNPAAGGEAGQGIAATLRGGAAGGSTHGKPSGTDRMTMVPVGAQSANGVGTCGADDNQAQAGHLVEAYQCHGTNVGPMGTLREGNGGVTAGVPFCVTGERTHALTSDGSDASEDGTGRGTPIIPFDTTQITSDKNYSQPREGDPCHPLAAGAHPPAVAFAENQRGEVRTSDTHPQLTTGGGKPGQGYPATATAYGVRRMTPLECERLQGFPDGWTEGISDSGRYRMLGNSIAVPCVQWIAERLVRVLDTA